MFCPLSGFDHTAIEWSLPLCLREMACERSSTGGAPFPVSRVWCTMLCLQTLQALDESFLLSTAEADGFEETIVDRGMEWLATMARPVPTCCAAAARRPRLTTATLPRRPPPRRGKSTSGSRRLRRRR